MTEEEDRAKEEAEAKAKKEAEEADKATDDEINIVVEAKAANKRKKEENDRAEKIVEREEKIMDRKEALAKLGGGSPAGSRPEVVEETPKEYSRKLMAGELNRV